MLSSFSVDFLTNYLLWNAKKNGWSLSSYDANISAQNLASQPYKTIYDKLRNAGYDVSNYVEPLGGYTPPVARKKYDANGKKLYFETLAEVGALIFSHPVYKDWLPQRRIMLLDGLNVSDYIGTYNRLANMGINLSAYANPNITNVVASQSFQNVLELDNETIKGFFYVVGVAIVTLVLSIRIYKNA